MRLVDTESKILSYRAVEAFEKQVAVLRAEVKKNEEEMRTSSKVCAMLLLALLLLASHFS